MKPITSRKQKAQAERQSEFIREQIANIEKKLLEQQSVYQMAMDLLEEQREEIRMAIIAYENKVALDAVGKVKGKKRAKRNHPTVDEIDALTSLSGPLLDPEDRPEHAR